VEITNSAHCHNCTR